MGLVIDHPGNVVGQLALGTGETDCWHCRRPTAVGAFLAMAGARVLVDEDEPDRWVVNPDAAVLSYVTRVRCEHPAQITQLVPAFRLDVTSSTGVRYWCNHCQSCGAKIGDFYTQSEPDGPFFAWPRDPESKVIEHAGCSGAPRRMSTFPSRLGCARRAPHPNRHAGSN